MAIGLGEFFLKITVDSIKGELSLKELVAQMGELEVASVGEITVLRALADRLEEIARVTLASALGFRDFEAATGESAENLQKWQAGAQLMGIKAEDVTHTISELNHQLALGEATGDYGGLKSLSAIFHSIDLTKFKSGHGSALLDYIRADTRHEFQHLAPAVQEAYLSKAGLGLAELQKVLSKRTLSDKDFARAVHDFGVMPQSDINQWSKIGGDMNLIEGSATRIKRTIASWIGPELLRDLGTVLTLMETIADYMDKLHGSDLGKEARLTYRALANPLSVLPDIVRSDESLGKKVWSQLQLMPVVPPTAASLLDNASRALIVNDYSQTTIKGEGLFSDKQLNQAVELIERAKKKTNAEIAKHLHVGVTQ